MIGVLLSGVLDDGVLGSAAIQSKGGTTIAQTPTDALFPSMPANAVEAGVIDHQADAADMSGLIKQLTGRVIEEREMERDNSMELENRIAMAKPFSTDFDTESRVGHGWTAEALLQARNGEMQSALWIALRSLQEKAKLSRHLVEQTGPGQLADRYHEVADEAEHAVSVLSERLSASIPHLEHGGG